MNGISKEEGDILLNSYLDTQGKKKAKIVWFFISYLIYNTPGKGSGWAGTWHWGLTLTYPYDKNNKSYIPNIDPETPTWHPNPNWKGESK
jgi:hypothetical protein